MESVLSVLQTMFDAVWWPFRQLGPLWGLAVFSAAAGVVILLVYRALVPGARIRRINDEILGCILETWYGRDSLRAIMRAQARILGLAAFKILLQWKALCALTLLIAWVLIGLHPWCEWRPLNAGEAAVLTVREPAQATSAELLPAQGIQVQTPPVRIPKRGETSWRVALESACDTLVGLRVNGQKGGLVICGEARLARLGPISMSAPNASVVVSVDYPAREWHLAGNPMHWIWVFSLIALLGAAGATLLLPSRMLYH